MMIVSFNRRVGKGTQKGEKYVKGIKGGGGEREIDADEK